MFWPPIDLVNMGKETRQMSVEEKKSFWASLSKDQKRLLIVLEKLLEEEPSLIEKVVRAPREHAAALSTGQSNGRSEDMAKVAREMPTWEVMAWDPPLGPKPRRGLFHIQCAELLSSIQYNWKDSQVQDDFCNMKLLAKPSQFPRYLWVDNGEYYNPERPSEGLLRNEILICAAYCLLFSPSSAKSMSASTTQVSGARGCSFKRSKGSIGLAKAYNLTKVTPAFIAYVAVVVRLTSIFWFAYSIALSFWIGASLSNNRDLFSEICGGFNYGDYYNQIREFLEAPKFASRSKVLLEWWNMRLFGSFNIGMQVVTEDDRDATLDALDAEVEGDPGLSGDEEPRLGEQEEDEDESGDE
ncbi:hypothetical protein RHS01_10264 [Rhizoctonia solani]|uniref:Uncharacterized protein n=1 Tax=Rhizoctonia solani TaxID=456999 RepID=A0A8H7I7D8_9AGAM|nr:hypothetical protein RHS01_10264 [Rhizoctonia solani]